ncbi:uncharacterized protein LOC100374665 [Saccoglossus kowalevskii]|uniref:Uncharacterized protein LOC100374665 n=1 Tax=Saccoglossus kowalevskii TaxID=10224 RepID=A0ABM0GKH4_SACKO|nr:PREDICTED: uncharacterized protein LOC100374665 [Saccoglossus kowalevskii]
MTKPRSESKTAVMKDIKDWASCNEDGTTLMIGAQLKDNVTEQRMLESKLYDLSKERYKFIVQVQLQRKAFIDKQQRKTSVMKDLLKGVDVSVQSKSTGAKMSDKVVAYRTIVEQIYPSRRRHRRVKSEEEDEYSTHSNVELVGNELSSRIPLYKTEPHPPLQLPTPDLTLSFPRRAMTSLPPIGTRSGTHFTRTAMSDGTRSSLRQRAVHDRRFVKLETTLSPIYNSPLTMDVKNYLQHILKREASNGIKIK